MPRSSLPILLRAGFLLLISASLVSASSSSVVNNDAAATCATLPRPCDTLWLVSTRAFPCSDPRLHAHALTYEVRDEQGQWQRTNLESFLATDDPSVRTVIWIHGNRRDSSDARNEGWAVYRALARCTTCDRPMRFVTFSWPSDRIAGRQLEDVRAKAARTSPNGYYLAWLIDKMGGDVPVSLIGYSYGARITTGALHLLGGGVLNGCVLDERVHPDRRPLRVALVAAAVDNHWLIPGHRLGNALSQVEHLTNIYNSCDRVVTHYRLLYGRRNNAEALGATGIVGLNCLDLDRTKILQFDACCFAGRNHEWENYLSSGAVVARLRAEALPLLTPPAVAQ